MCYFIITQNCVIGSLDTVSTIKQGQDAAELCGWHLAAYVCVKSNRKNFVPEQVIKLLNQKINSERKGKGEADEH